MKTINELKTELEQIIDRIGSDPIKVKPFFDMANEELAKIDADAFFYQDYYEALVGSKSRLAASIAAENAALEAAEKERENKAQSLFESMVNQDATVEGNLLTINWERSVPDGVEYNTSYYDIKDMSQVSSGCGYLEKLRAEKTDRQFYDKEVIINLTQHAASDEQVESGVIEPTNKVAVQAAITFDAIPSAEEMVQRAQLLASIAKESGAKKAMIGGAPFFMSTLERVLSAHGITPVYAFSVRESVEKDGVKTSVFRHAGFVEL